MPRIPARAKWTSAERLCPCDPTRYCPPENRENFMLRMTGAALVAGLILAAPAVAADAPAEIKIGTLYASSGRYASISMPVYSALKLWVDQKNADGGVYVKAFDKKLPVKLVAYDDQSNTATASTLYNQLITQ